jgi:predicted RNA methylase
MSTQNLIRFEPKYNDVYEDQKNKLNNPQVDFFNCYKSFKEDCIDCESTLRETFDEIFARLELKKEMVFLDCGSGLGHTLYLSSSIFESVYGVEYNTAIVDICKNNLNLLHVSNATVINCDILNLEIGILDKVNVFYMFNPFIGKVFENFTKNIVKSITRNNREVWIIYLNAVCEDILQNYDDILPLFSTFYYRKKINIYHHE